MDRGDIGFGLLIVGCVAGGIGLIAAVVYVAVSVAKMAWSS